jgi:endonuclease YncB( thermonuclease family)
MASEYFLTIQGDFVIVGKEPDGDSVRFIAHNPNLYQRLHRAHRIRLSSDGSVQLRFDGIDAPEVHYGTASQPMGTQARDFLLQEMGFRNIEYTGKHSTRVKSAEPESIPGFILSQAAEANGRPVAYALLETQADQLQDGQWAHVDQAMLEKTLNHLLLSTGMAYYTVYTSMPYLHRKHLAQIAFAARENKKGVWAIDATSYFELVDDSSISPEGQLILPKLFRRATDYLKDVAKGFQGNLSDWIIWVSQQSSRNENDLVVLHNTTEVRLSELLLQQNKNVAFQADLLDIMFVEK